MQIGDKSFNDDLTDFVAAHQRRRLICSLHRETCINACSNSRNHRNVSVCINAGVRLSVCRSVALLY